MNTTRLHPGTLAAVVLGGGAVALVAGPAADGLADDRRPAVRVAPARPLDAAEPVARAAPAIPPPPFDPLDPSRRNPTLEPPKGEFRSAFGTADAGRPTPLLNTKPQTPPAAVPGQPPTTPAPGKGVTGWFTDRWQSVRTAVAGPSNPAQPPAPKVGAQSSPSGGGWQAYPPFVQPGAAAKAGTPNPQQPAPRVNAPTPAATAAPFRGTTAAGRPGYAGAPAYRWYGWGTTVPGANPFAPAGEYPAGSSGWYALSGATPGAFPVPVTNAFRPPPNGDPPGYVVTAPPPAAFAGPKLTYNPPAPRPIAESRTPSPPTPDMRWQPVGGQPPVPRPVAPPATDPKWTPAPIFRGQDGG